jgi:hypothetical protein
MNFFDHKGLGNNLLQLCPKVVKHPVCELAFNEIYCYVKIFVNKLATDNATFSRHQYVAKRCRNSEFAADDATLIRSQQVAKYQKVRGVTGQSCINQPTCQSCLIQDAVDLRA